MSKAALSNADRVRDIEERALPAAVLRKTPGAKGFKMGGCWIIVAVEMGDWHLSISHKTRLPTWEEVRDARYALVPDEVTMAMLLPPADEYVNAHDFCLHLWEIHDR